MPSLSRTHTARITKRIQEAFLSADLLDTQHQVVVIQSCTGTAKTTSVVEYARTKRMPVLSVCARRTQVNEHCRVFQDEQNGLPAPTVPYDHSQAFRPGVDNYVTTLDSLRKIKKVFQHHATDVGKYLLYLDEFHSLVSYALNSSTLDATRKQVLSSLVWLLNHAGRVILTDNLILDRDLNFLDSIRRASDPIAFIINDYQKYTGIKVCHHRDDAETVIAAMINDLRHGRSFTAPCNTKKRVDEVVMRLRQCSSDADTIKCYTSEQGEFDAENLDADWSGCGVVYSPTITTGVDYNPSEAQNVYLFLDGDQTVDPPTALQMIARNRKIKELHICSTNMTNRPVWSTVQEMHRSFHDLKQNTRAMKIMRDISDCRFNECTGDFEYSENKFSKLYMQDRWLDNVMRSSYMHTLETLLTSRGFGVVRAGVPESVCDAYDWEPTQNKVKQQKKELFQAYICDGDVAKLDAKQKECLDRRLAKLRCTKQKLCALLEAHPEWREICEEIFTDARAFQNTQNLFLALCTDAKLRAMFANEGSVNYELKRQEMPTAKCLLLRELIAVMNRSLGDASPLKPHDLTLRQSQYDQYAAVQVTEGLWQQYRHHKRTEKEKPADCKSLMSRIYYLAKELFGTRFVRRQETSKKGRRCYNYSTDENMVAVAIELTNWNRMDLADIQGEIVQSYDLERRKQAAACAADDRLCSPAAIADASD